MKRLILFSVISILLFQSEVLGQSYCNSITNVPNSLASIPQSQFIVGQPRYVVRVFIHIMRKSNGTGGQTVADVNTALGILKNDLEAQNICISLLGMDEIKNDAYYNSSFVPGIDNNGDGKFDAFAPNSHTNAIDIYMFGSGTDVYTGGIAANIGATALVIGGSAFGSNLAISHVLSHEFGHCLGLYHTFHGLCEGGCAELVNGSNSTSCGDYVSDTPADPTRFSMNQTTCAYTGATCGVSSVDANGQSYTPNPNLIMAYVTPNCMSYFTNGQGTRMRNFIANTPILQNVTVSNNLALANVTVGSGSNILYDALNTITTTNVASVSGGRLSLRAQNSITLNSVTNFNSGSVVSVSIDNLCSTLDQNNSAKTELAFDHDHHEETLTIFPNPISSGFLNFSKNASSYKLINASGDEVLQGKNVDKVDIDGLAKGLYFLHLDSNTFKVVIE